MLPSKTGAAMDIPTAPVVVDWFKELRTLAGESGYVLPAHFGMCHCAPSRSTSTHFAW
jgi:hypothetical protein